MKYDLSEEIGALDLVNITLQKMGINPSVIQPTESGPHILSISMQENPSKICSCFCNCAESQEGEVCFVLNVTLGEIDARQHADLLQFCNIAHADVQCPGTLFVSQSGSDDSDWYLTLRFLLRVESDPQLAMRHIEETFDELDDFFHQAKWAAYEIITGGDVNCGISMLSIGQTYATA